MKAKLKRIFSLLMCVSMGAALLTSCGGGQSQTKESPESKTEAAKTTETAEKTSGGDKSSGQDDVWTGEVDHIVMTYAHAGVEPAGLDAVLAAINEITVKKIGVEIEFKPVSIFELASNSAMWIAGGEQLDIMVVAYTGLKPFIDQGMLMDISGIISEQGSYLTQLSESYDFIVEKNGGVYGLMTLPVLYKGGSIMLAVDDLKAAGLDYTNGQTVTLDDVDQILAAIKAVKPDSYPLQTYGSAPATGYTILHDTLGADYASGVIMGLDSTKVVNYFETPEYKSFLEHIRGWYENGYIMKEAATADITEQNDKWKNGDASAQFNDGSEGHRLSAEFKSGREMILLTLVEPYCTSNSESASVYWTVPVTSKHPEAAVRFLDFLYQDGFGDAEISNLLTWGIEGVNYVMVDEESREIGYPEGVDASNNTYEGLPFVGYGSNSYVRGDNAVEEDAAREATALTRKTKGVGFSYDPGNMTNQIIAVNAVISEYQAALETGSADLEPIYAEFIQKLHANGIDEIIADKQAQFDEWLAQQ